MSLEKIPGREYLKSNNSEEYELYRDLYFGDHYKHFPINEFDFALTKYNYVAYNVVKFATDALTNLYGINKAVIDFGNAELNTAFEAKRKAIDFDEKIEIMIRDYRIYGNSYVAINKKETSNIENINPELVYADYADYNLGMEAKKYTVVYDKDFKEGDVEVQIYLLVDYLPGFMEITAYREDSEIYTEVDPVQYFPELFENVDKSRDGFKIIIETGLDTQSIVALHAPQKDKFYGESQLNSSAIGLQELVNKLGNLAKFAVTNNTIPKLKLSESSARILQSIIDDNGVDSMPIPSKLSEVKNTVRNNSFRAVSWAFSSMVAKMGKKLMFFKEDGQGKTEYLINPYKLDDLFKLQEMTEQKLLRELQISPGLYNENLSITSGIAYKRLMQLSIQEVENMRIKSQDQIALVAQSLMILDGFDAPAPKVEFQPVIEEEVALEVGTQPQLDNVV